MSDDFPDEAPIMTPGALAQEDQLDRSLRPPTLEDFIGQQAVCDQLSVSLEAATARDEPLDHGSAQFQASNLEFSRVASSPRSGSRA